MRFEEAYEVRAKRLTQEEASQILVMSDRKLRWHVGRFEADGIDGLIDWRIEQICNRRAPVRAVLKLIEVYQVRRPV